MAQDKNGNGDGRGNNWGEDVIRPTWEWLSKKNNHGFFNHCSLLGQWLLGM